MTVGLLDDSKRAGGVANSNTGAPLTEALVCFLSYMIKHLQEMFKMSSSHVFRGYCATYSFGMLYIYMTTIILAVFIRWNKTKFMIRLKVIVITKVIH